MESASGGNRACIIQLAALIFGGRIDQVATLTRTMPSKISAGAAASVRIKIGGKQVSITRHFPMFNAIVSTDNGSLRPTSEVPMRTLIVFAIAVVVLATGFQLKNIFIRGSSGDPASIAKAMATSKPLWPHEIHLNYESMKELPVRETEKPF
jgi:hypothetical protein